MAQQNKDTNELIKVRRQKLADLQAAGKNPFEIMKYDVTHHSKEIKDNFEELEGKEVAVAGRLMFKRVMGKASFCNVQDLQGGIQAYVARDEIGVESYQDFKKMDIGDIVGIKGKVFATKTGEKSIHAEEVILLSKSLKPLPEKFHGLTDTDTRYRQRYVDLIMNEESKEVFNLNEDCEIWVQGQVTSKGTYESPKMIGTIPKDLLNKSKDEIVAYFKEKYPNKEIASMNQYEIILGNAQKKEPSKANKYSIEEKDGFIYVYKYDKEGTKSQVEKTDISVDSLPKSVQEELTSGILVDNEDDAYSKLENFGS